MFERLKYLYRFYRAYRGAKRDGLDHEAALEEATRRTVAAQAARDGLGPEETAFAAKAVPGLADVMRRAREGDIGEAAAGREAARVIAAAQGRETGDWPTFSEALREAWCKGEEHYVSHHGLDIASYEVGYRALEVTERHVGLIRRMRFLWDGTEVGAPMLDPERPYGERDLFGQIEEVFGDADEAGQLARHVEMMIAFNHFIHNARLAPGDYAASNVTIEEIREQFAGYGAVTDDDLGIGADGRFRFTQEHAMLLKRLSVEWSNAHDNEDRLDDGQYPALAVDPKRPYGDMTYFQVDMAQALGVLPPPPADGRPARLPDDLEARLGRVHWQMLGAVQVFVENAAFEPGAYAFE